MKLSMKLIFVSIALLFLSSSVSAQSEKQMKRAQDDADGIATALNLDDETKQKIYDINIKTYAKLKEIRKEGLSKAETKEKNKAEWKATREEIKELLGPDKAREYQKYRKELRQKKKAQKQKN